MRVTLVCDRKVPPARYGGTERVVFNLASELLLLGHSVSLISPKGSFIPGCEHLFARTKEDALSLIPARSDLVHFHGWLPDPSVYESNWLMTLHGNTDDPNCLPQQCCCLTRNHADRHQKRLYVYNGLDPRDYRVGDPHNYVLYFSKVRRRVKGAPQAIKMANQYNFDLKMGGGSRLDLLKVGGFWESWSPRIQLFGELGGERKIKLFSHAKAFLFPILWDEPFGLVLIEALLSGVPVIATPKGSVPEIINSSVGAFLEPDSDVSDILTCFERIDRNECRQYAIEHFSSKIMVGNYVDIYQRMLDREVIQWSF